MISAGLLGLRSSQLSSMKFRMDKLRRIAPLLCGVILSVLVRESVCVPGIYLISPPTGAPVARPRSDDSMMEPSESLWIGSHKINWSPLPLFLKFTNPGLYQEQKQQAEARKFEAKTPIILAKRSMFKNFDPEYNDRRNHVRQYSHHTTRYPTQVGRFPEFPPRPQLPQPYLEARSISSFNMKTEKTYVPEQNYEPEIVTGASQTQVTTPSPIFVSTSATLLVSPPEAVAALSGPGTSINPIVEKLRRMTEWSRQNTDTTDANSNTSPSTFSKKEGKPTPVYPFQERKLRVKKRLIDSNGNPVKKYKHNIAEIIADDTIDNNPVPPPPQESSNPSASQLADRTDILKYKKESLKNSKSSNKHKGQDYNYRDSYEDDFRPSSPATTSGRGIVTFRPSNPATTDEGGLVIMHPTNAAFLIKDPLLEGRQGRHSSKRRDRLVRKEKKLGFFKKEGTAFKPSQPFSFRFGPEDARVSPYRF